MLYITEKEIKQILSEDVTKVCKIIEETFLIIDSKEYSLGGANRSSHGLRMDYTRENKHKLFIAMPGYLGNPFNISGIKWHGPMSKHNKATRDSQYSLILNDPDTGIPVSMMSANTITDYRTAAVSLLAACKIASPNSEILGIIGPGKINKILSIGILQNFKNLNKILIKGRGKNSIESFINEINKIFPNVECQICETTDQVCEQSDIVSINTGFSFEKISDMPLIKSKHTKPNSLYLCSAFAHFPDALIAESHKITDLYAMYEEYAKELGYPSYKYLSNLGNRFCDLVKENRIDKKDIIDLSSIVSGKQIIPNDGKIKLFSSGGIALCDLAVGHYVLQMAKKYNLGTKLNYE
jgi:ornithine cyclodeaminase